MLNARSFRLALLAVLLAVFGATAMAAPPAKLTPEALHAVRVASGKKSAAGLERNAKGQFLPKIAQEKIAVRAYEKYEARKASGQQADGFDKVDFLQAKSELETETMAQNKAAREAKAAAK